MTREPEDEVDGEARLGMELICSDEQLVEDDLKFWENCQALKPIRKY